MYGRGLETFLAVAMSRTLKEAATVLHQSQSTVSYNLKSLEVMLGVELIDRRKGHKVTQLTAAGSTLLPIAMKWSEVIREIQSIKSTPRHYLSIGAVESINQCLLPDLYHTLNGRKMNINVSTNYSIDLYKLLEERTVNVAFVVTQVPSKNVAISLVRREKMCVLRSGLCECEEFSTITTDELDPVFELYYDWSFPFQMWHDHVWANQTSGSRLKVGTMCHLDAFLAGDPRYWIVAPESVALMYRKKGLKIQNITPEPPERLCYKITHRKPHPALFLRLKCLTRCSGGGASTQGRRPRTTRHGPVGLPGSRGRLP